MKNNVLHLLSSGCGSRTRTCDLRVMSARYFQSQLAVISRKCLRCKVFAGLAFDNLWWSHTPFYSFGPLVVPSARLVIQRCYDKAGLWVCARFQHERVVSAIIVGGVERCLIQVSDINVHYQQALMWLHRTMGCFEQPVYEYYTATLFNQ